MPPHQHMCYIQNTTGNYDMKLPRHMDQINPTLLYHRHIRLPNSRLNQLNQMSVYNKKIKNTFKLQYCASLSFIIFSPSTYIRVGKSENVTQIITIR